MKKKSVAANYFYQTIYLAVTMIVPLFVAPYLTRTIGKNEIGVFTFANTFAYYFIVFSMLGIAKYGPRAIASSGDDKIRERSSFWSLYLVHAAFSVVALIVYFIVIFFIPNHRTIYFIEALYVLTALFDVTWFFQGKEDFRSVAVVNALFKIAEMVLIFTFVKSEADLWKYALIAATCLLSANVVLFLTALLFCKPTKVLPRDCAVHLKPLSVLFVSVIAATLYTLFDKTLIGLIVGTDDVAIYEYSNKIINIPKAVALVIGTILYPRICFLVKEKDTAEHERLVRLAALITSFISLLSIFGLLAVSGELSVIYYGEEFSECGTVIRALSPVIYIICIGDVIRTGFLLPYGRDKEFTVCLCLGAAINLVLSAFLIPFVGIYGAIIGTLSAELFGLVYQIVLCRKQIRFSAFVQPFVAFSVIGAIMFVEILFFNRLWSFGVLSLVAKILIGGGTATVLSFFYLMLFQKDCLRSFRLRRTR